MANVPQHQEKNAMQSCVPACHCSVFWPANVIESPALVLNQSPNGKTLSTLNIEAPQTSNQLEQFILFLKLFHVTHTVPCIRLQNYLHIKICIETFQFHFNCTSNPSERGYMQTRWDLWVLRNPISTLTSQHLVAQCSKIYKKQLEIVEI